MNEFQLTLRRSIALEQLYNFSFDSEVIGRSVRPQENRIGVCKSAPSKWQRTKNKMEAAINGQHTRPARYDSDDDDCDDGNRFIDIKETKQVLRFEAEC